MEPDLINHLNLILIYLIFKLNLNIKPIKFMVEMFNKVGNLPLKRRVINRPSSDLRPHETLIIADTLV